MASAIALLLLTVAGVSYASDRSSYAMRGLKYSVAEQQLAATPDEVDVYYDPAAPEEAFSSATRRRSGTSSSRAEPPERCSL